MNSDNGGCLVLLGLAMFPVVALGFAHRLGTPWLDAFFLAGILELLPVLAVAQVGMALRTPMDRMPAYGASAATILVIGGLALALGLRRFEPEALGLGPIPLGTVALWTGGLLVAAALLVGLVHLLQTLFDVPESPLMEQLLPRTADEKTAFVGLSFAAGFGEELAFRSYAIPVLAPLLGGAWPAAAFTSVAFGVLHAYQGSLGMFRTAALGFVLAGSFVISGSVWPAIAAHVVIDLVGGLWLGPRMSD